MKLLITGAAGHLGSTLIDCLSARHELFATTSRELDVRDARAVSAAVGRIRPDAILNCAAYTEVDAAEDEPTQALEVNAIAVRGLAAAARDAGAILVHYSTDFVFDGTASVPYSEDVAPNPRSVYAASKLLGEWFTREVERSYVLRVESLFGCPSLPSRRRTSVDRIVDAIVAGETARVFVDRTVSPSYAPDVASATVFVLEQHVPAGLYHCVNTGVCTWEELAREVARRLGRVPDLLPVPLTEAGLRAQRPKFCGLSNEKLRRAGLDMPSWQEAVARYLDARGLVQASSGTSRQGG